jgi:branched-chain amino acid transport system permease protein
VSSGTAARPAASPPRARGRRLPWDASRTIAIVAIGVWATYAVAHGSLYTQGLVLTAAVFGILALSLDLVAGMLGLYSLGHAGLFALGAYGTALMHNDHGTNVFVLLPLCVVGVGLVGLVLGALSLRVSGLYFAITTFVFTLVLTVLASDFQFTGGLEGQLGPVFPDFAPGLSDLGQSLSWAIGLSLGVTVLLTVCIRRSPLYPVLLAIRDAEPMASAAGVRTSVVKVAMFGVSAAMAGLAGWAFSFLGVVSPGQFTWTISVNILVMVILGGMNTTLGPLLGAAFISMFPAWVNIDPLWQEVLFGSLFVAVIVLAPSGAMGLVRGLTDRVRRRGRPDAASETLMAAERQTAQEDLRVPHEIAVAEHAAAPSAPVAPAAAAAPDGTDAVRVRDLVFAYGEGPTVVDHVDFTVRRGTVHGLIGPNGSGKSTLVNLIAGRLRPTGGTIEIDGRRVDRTGAPARARLGFTRTFQDATLVQELTAGENVGIGLYSQVRAIPLRGPLWPLLPRSRRDARVLRERSHGALEAVGAADWEQARVGDVPHGVEQLTQLASATVGRPRTIVLDEPLAGLAPSEVEHIAQLLNGLRDRGVSVVLIEHQPRFVFAVCDEVTVLNAGQVVASGPAAEVRADERVRKVYLGQ